MEQKGILPVEWAFRRCVNADLDAIMDLQETVVGALENQEIFASSEREENESYLSDPNFILGCFDGNRLIAYASFGVHGESPDNLGWDLGYPVEKVLSCANLGTIIVHPDYRGYGLQRQLIKHALALAAQNPQISYVLCTVSPKNEYSLHNVQAEGFTVLTKKLKYGGKERFILGREPVLPDNK